MNRINEQWKPVKDYEELYEISNLGRVKSLGNDKSRKEKILKHRKRRNGYLQVGLCRNGKVKMFPVHRLVATAFIPNPFGLPEINHRNEDKTNNCVSNLEFCTREYNINYGSRTKRAAASMTNHPARSKAVEASRFPDFRIIELRFASTKEAGRNGYFSSAVSACCNGCYCSKGNFYKGLFWRYVFSH